MYCTPNHLQIKPRINIFYFKTITKLSGTSLQANAYAIENLNCSVHIIWIAIYCRLSHFTIPSFHTCWIAVFPFAILLLLIIITILSIRVFAFMHCILSLIVAVTNSTPSHFHMHTRHIDSDAPWQLWCYAVHRTRNDHTIQICIFASNIPSSRQVTIKITHSKLDSNVYLLNVNWLMDFCIYLLCKLYRDSADLNEI